MKSISDDDLCSSCTNCSYNPGKLSMCAFGFPASVDADGYAFACHDYSDVGGAAEVGLNKSEYRKARRLLRDNGRASLKRLDGLTRGVMERLIDEQKSQDMLAERADVVAYCLRMGTHHTALHTADIGLLHRFYERKYSA